MERMLSYLLRFAFVVQGLFLGGVDSSHFRGITMSWKATNNSSEVDIEWMVWWRHTSCDENLIGNGTLISSGNTLSCDQCTNTNLASVTYQCTDYNEAEDWQGGVGSTRFTIEPGIDAFDISFSGCCWLSLGNGGSSSYKAQAHVDLTPYNGVINSSPVTSWIPIFRVQQGCQATLNIPISDPDGDVVKCRWPLTDAEGGSMNQMPNTVLDEMNCVLTINAVGTSGWYAIALIVEDFPSPTSMTAKSKVPLQFLVNVYSSYGNNNCTDQPVLIDPTPDQGDCRGVAPGALLSMEIRARASTAEIIEFETTSPVGMTIAAISLVPGKTNEYYAMATWTPTTSQEGQHLFCFSALDVDGLMSEVRCVHFSVEEPPSVIETWPAPDSSISVNLGLLTFQFDTNVTLATASTNLQISSRYGMRLYRGSITQTTEGAIAVSVSVTLYPYLQYFITLIDGVVTTTGPCPIPSARHTIRVYTNTQLPVTTESTALPDTTRETTTTTTRGTTATTTRETTATTYPGPGHTTQPTQQPWVTIPQTDTQTRQQIRTTINTQPSPQSRTNAPWTMEAWTNPPPMNTQPSPQPSMDCSDSGMTVFIPRSVIGDTMAAHLHFMDPACVGSHHNATHVKIATTYNRCGTFMEIRGENVIFFNVIHDEAVPVTPGSVITRDRDIEIPVQCIMDLEGMAEISFQPDTSKITFREDGYGSFNFSLSLYHDNNYITPYLPADYPIHVTLGDKLSFEARTWTEPGLELFVQTCRATPTSNPDDFHRYTFIKDGCIEDNTLVFRPSYDPGVERFEIDVFAFIDTLPQPVVYVHCDMIVCNSSDPYSRCSLGCSTLNINSLLNMRRRHERSTSGSRPYIISQGPISLMGKQGGEESSSGMSLSAQMPILLTTVCLLVACVLVLGGVVVMMRKRNRVLHQYAPVPVDDEED